MNHVEPVGGQQKAGPAANKLELAGVVALVAPLVATVGLFKATGTIGRIQRDHPVGLVVAVALVLIAGGLLTVASYLKGRGSQGDSDHSTAFWLSIAGIVGTLLGFGLAIALVVGNASKEPRPRITASLNRNESKLTAEVAASNLKTSHRLAIKVDLATLKPGKTIEDEFPFAKGGSLPLERAYVGPNGDGDVKQTISLPVPQGGKYTDVVIKAFTGQQNSSCQELPGATGDPGTACTFLTLDATRGAQEWSKKQGFNRWKD